MNLTKWDPFRELEDLTQRLNRMFGRAPVARDSDSEPISLAEWAPMVDVSESDDAYLIKAELPGIKREDNKVTLHDGTLTLQGERRQEKEEKGKRQHRIERSYGRFLRSFALPSNVEDGKVMAEFKDGLLTLELPKSPAAKPKAIEVRVN